MRDYYFGTHYDLGSSGVECWTYGELRRMTGLDDGDLDSLPLDDSPSYGGERLRTAIAERFADGDPERVIATHGSTEAIFLAMNALLEPGDQVVTVAPTYHALRSVAAAIGCRLVPWTLRVDRGFAADLDELRRLVTSRTRMVVVNFPHNPTGASITAAEQAELIRICAAAGSYLVWDAAFAELCYGCAPLPDPCFAYDRAVSVGTLSKAYGLPGLRFGWCIAQPETLASFLSLRDCLTICMSPLVEALALAAIRHGDLLVTARLGQVQRNLDVLRAWAAELDGLIGWVPPRGGVTAFPRLRVPDVDAFCRCLAEERGVLLVPGSCFDRPAHVRLGFGGESDRFAEGLRLVRDALCDCAC